MKSFLTSSGDRVLVSDCDFKKVANLCWSTLKSKEHKILYARRTFPGRKHVFLHRFILDLPSGSKVHVDHRNGNGLDNRRCNIRICTHSQNLFNSKLRSNNKSGFKGVSWNKWHKAWMVKIRAHNQYIFLGYFHDRIAGAKEYDRNAKRLFGSFARLNFPPPTTKQ